MLNPTRKDIASDLIRLPMSEVLGVLGVSAKQQKLAECNKVLMSSPTLPALLRFTGVLYDALSATTLSPAAWRRLAVGDALFGLLMASGPHGERRCQRKAGNGQQADRRGEPEHRCGVRRHGS